MGASHDPAVQPEHTGHREQPAAARDAISVAASAPATATPAAASTATAAGAAYAPYLPQALQFFPMQIDDVDQVLAIEESVYQHPWSRANFLDSLFNHYEAWVLRAPDGRIIGYVLVLLAVNEAHLLNVAVCAQAQGQGVGRRLLDHALALARGAQMEVMVLEVRPSNARALQIYQRYGFVQTRRRREYYPAHDGKREDALEMLLNI